MRVKSSHTTIEILGIPEHFGQTEVSFCNRRLNTKADPLKLVGVISFSLHVLAVAIPKEITSRYG